VPSPPGFQAKAGGKGGEEVADVASSDPRDGDVNLDTNSGVLSRLRWTASSWERVNLVRGLPRSEGLHASNGLQLDPSTNTLYIAQGGNTNMGALQPLRASARVRTLGGHPNPTRGNISNTFNANEQSPVTTANPVECDYRVPGDENASLTTFTSSTNGLTEYTASNFGTIRGDLLAASFDEKIYRIKLNSTGDGVVSKLALF
jgi:hypothetical protein